VRLHHLIDRLQAQPGVATVGIVLVVLILIGLAAAKPLTRSVLRAFLFGVLLFGWTITWWLVNSPLEGRTLVRVSYNHGFTVADSIGVPALILTLVLLSVAIARRPQRPQGPRMSLNGRPTTGPCPH
jgi:hypothetical protein